MLVGMEVIIIAASAILVGNFIPLDALPLEIVLLPTTPCVPCHMYVLLPDKARGAPTPIIRDTAHSGFLSDVPG